MTVSERYGTSGVMVRNAIGLCIFALLSVSSCVAVSNNPGSVATEFVHAFVATDAETAKRMAVSEQWSAIDEWIEGRQEFRWGPICEAPDYAYRCAELCR